MEGVHLPLLTSVDDHRAEDGLLCSPVARPYISFLPCPEPCPLPSRAPGPAPLASQLIPVPGPSSACRGEGLLQGLFLPKQRKHRRRRTGEDGLPVFPDFFLHPVPSSSPHRKGQEHPRNRKVGIYDCGVGEQTFHPYHHPGPTLHGSHHQQEVLNGKPVFLVNWVPRS